jgi:predicted nucleotidyltransferase
MCPAQDEKAGMSAAMPGILRAAPRGGCADLTPMPPLIETHRAELLAQALRRGVTGVRVFGSMSRGDDSDNNSDVDLLVNRAPGTSALALGGLLLDAQELLGRRVDVVTQASLHPALRERVMVLAVPL